MKKIFYFIAFVAIMIMTACGNKTASTETPVVDTLAVDTVVVDTLSVDSVVVDSVEVVK